MDKALSFRPSPLTKSIFIGMLAPTILMNLTTAIASLADTMIIGHYLDDLSLSVVTFVTPIYMVINLFSALFSMGGCICMGIDAGRGDRQGANRAFSLAMELLLGTGLVLTLCGVFFPDPITRALGAGEDVFELVRQYAGLILLGAPVFMIRTGMAFFVRGDGRAKLCMAAMFVSIATDITLNFVFVGFMSMGVIGAALSTVLGNIPAILIMCAHFLSSKNTLRFIPCLDRSLFRIAKNGGSAALQFVYQFTTILLINRLLASIAGTDGVVVYTVVFNLSLVSLSVFEGISQTIQPMVSVFHGEGSNRKIRETLTLALTAVLIICGSVTLILELFPRLVPLAFGLDSAELMERAAVAVRIYAVSMLITTFNVVAGYYLQSTEHSSTAATLVSLRSFLVFLPSVFALGLLFGINGIWAAYTVSELVSLGALILMLRSKQRKLSAQGSRAGLLLLDRKKDEGSFCLSFMGRRDEKESFSAAFSRAASENRLSPQLQGAGAQCIEALLPFLEGRKGAYLEAEYIPHRASLILRHNSRDQGAKAVLPGDTGDIRGENTPVLGIERLQLVQGE